MPRLIDITALFSTTTTDKDVQDVHGEIVATSRRTLALAVVLGAMLKFKFSEIGKGHFKSWLNAIPISDSAGNRYRNIYGKWLEKVGTNMHAPKAKCFMQPIGLSIAGMPADAVIPIPKDWQSKTYREVAHPRDPDELPIKENKSDLIEVEWVGVEIPTAASRHRLDPGRWQADLHHPACPDRVAAHGVIQLRRMVVSALARLRDRGDWDKCRNEAVALLEKVVVVYRTIDKDGDLDGMLKKLAEPPDDGGDGGGGRFAFDSGDNDENPPENEKHAKEKEQERIEAAFLHLEQTSPEAIKTAIEATYSGMRHPLTAQEIADGVSKAVGSAVSAQRVYRVLHGPDRWPIDARYLHPPRFKNEEFDADEQRSIAEEAGWVDPKAVERAKGRTRSRKSASFASIMRKIRSTRSANQKAVRWVRYGDEVRIIQTGETGAIDTLEPPDVAGVKLATGGWTRISREEHSHIWEFVDPEKTKRRVKYIGAAATGSPAP